MIVVLFPTTAIFPAVVKLLAVVGLRNPADRAEKPAWIGFDAFTLPRDCINNSSVTDRAAQSPEQRRDPNAE
jgi:hypothetical protein